MNDDITDIEDDGPASELLTATVLAEDEAVLLDAYRGLDDVGRQTVWTMLRFLYRIRRLGVDGGP
jgi:hypothetical protein